jgi:hypothetical protein
MRVLNYIVPGLVIQAVLVGGGYATGRELVEFFISRGPATALLGMVLTALLFSAVAMISFELARQYRAYDYRSFCRVFLGRFWVLFVGVVGGRGPTPRGHARLHRAHQLGLFHGGRGVRRVLWQQSD